MIFAYVRPLVSQLSFQMLSQIVVKTRCVDQEIREVIAGLRQVVQVRPWIHDVHIRQAWCADVDVPEEWPMGRLHRAQVVSRLM